MSTPTADLCVRDAIRPAAEVPTVRPDAFFKDTLEAMTQHRLGIACVVDDGTLVGIVTDGDVRRIFLREQKPVAALWVDDTRVHMNPSPMVASPDDSLAAAVQKMGDREIMDLPVVDGDGLFVGLLHLHAVVRALLAPAGSGTT